MMLWWRSEEQRAHPDAQPVEKFPDLVEEGSRAIRSAIARRVHGYTPEWRAGAGGGGGADAGVALVKVFGEQAAPVFSQANRLADKYRREQLRIAGVLGRGPSVARVMVVFSLLENAQDSVLIAAGTQLIAPAADGQGQVVFETSRAVHATPAKLALFVGEIGSRGAQLQPNEVTAASPLLTFGPRPQPGSALWLGFSGPLPFPKLAIHLDLVFPDALQRSVRFGAPVGSDEPMLAWEVLTGRGLVPADVYVDETGALRQSGIVEVGTNTGWDPLPNPVLPADPPSPALRWLRVSLRHGRYEVVPRLATARVNAVPADGVETVRDEVLEPVEELGETNTRRFRTSRTPVLSGTVRIVIDAPDPADIFDVAPTIAGGQQTQWTEVPTLATSRPYDRHFELDETTGIITFGDGVDGAAVPAGFRQVQAPSYCTGGGRATAVVGSAGFIPRGTVPFLAAVDNPFPAIGGADTESVDALVRRGPDLLRAGNRAVTVVDVEALALGAPGVDRVVALAGLDTDGTRRPGQLTLVVVGASKDSGPPIPTTQTLDAVAQLVADSRHPLVPLGAHVVIRAPRFVTVELYITARFDPEADQSVLALEVVAAANAYLDPVGGGDDGQGWPLGGVINYRRLVAAIAGVGGVTSVRRVGIMVAGRNTPPCHDADLPAFYLPSPGHHQVIPLVGGE